MTHKSLFLFLLSGALCAGQAAQTTCGPAPDSGSGTTPCAVSAPEAATPSSVIPEMQTEAGTTPPTQTEAGTPPPTQTHTGTMPPTWKAAHTETTTDTSRVAGPVTTRSEFESFAEDAAGVPLPVYGRKLFSQVPTTFAPMDRIPVPANYVLGPGDQLVIQVWGKIDVDSTVVVDRNGQIFLPKVGALTVAGLRYDQIKGFLESAIGNLYKGFELNVTMGQLRSIQIFVLGSARRPGVYTVSSLSTLINALFASGGPSATGSMRHVQLRRGGNVVTELDIYDLLRRGDKSKDAQLLPGDVIYIPPVGAQVAIMGSINEPGIYELKGPTTVASALKDAGGLSNLAARDRAILERIENHRRRRVDDFPLDAAGLERPLHDGDMLKILPISPQFENAVTLRGNVAQPGRFPWREGMRISDLISSRNFLITRSYWAQQNHLARNGHVDMMTDLSQHSAEINWEYAAIERLDKEDLSTHVIAFNLGNAIDNPASSDNQVLKPGDVITIFSRRDLPLPEDKHAAFVRVSGEVNAPGVYRIRPGETLREVVEQAGGLTSHSYLYASQLTRVSTRQAEEEELHTSINQMQRDLLSRYATAPQLNLTGATDQQSQFAAQQAMIAKLSAFQPTGRIVLDMKPQASSVSDIPDFTLEDGDGFYIPPRQATVQVSGAVYNANAFRYEPRKRLSAYLSDAGGPSREADTKRIFLVRADGRVVSRQAQSFWHDSFENITLLPGDAIIVPSKLRSPNGFSTQFPYWAQIIGSLSQTAMTGAVMTTVY